ncbi:MAG: hypothetical protein SCK28_10425 [Bacillota bacterium]|nr:hypothetical protein [Bacillota bacterium]
MAARIILIVLVALIALGGIGETYSNFSEHKDYIDTIVTLAIEDTSWLKASNKDDLYIYFGRMFNSELTEELVEETWPYFENPSDMYHNAIVEKTKTMVIGNSAYTIASIELYNTSFVEPILEATGTGVFRLTFNNNLWRIVSMDFTWNYLDNE